MDDLEAFSGRSIIIKGVPVGLFPQQRDKLLRPFTQGGAEEVKEVKNLASDNTTAFLVVFASVELAKQASKRKGSPLLSVSLYQHRIRAQKKPQSSRPLTDARVLDRTVRHHLAVREVTEALSRTDIAAEEELPPSPVDPPVTEAETTLRLILDLGYEWPKEPRPRKERQIAVLRQISNFLEDVAAFPALQLQKHFLKSGGSQSPGFHTRSTHLLLVGEGVLDVQPRVETMLTKKQFETCGATVWRKDLLDVSVQPISLGQCLAQLQPAGECYYLSPDAPEYLDTLALGPLDGAGSTSPPTLIVGALVDRKVKRGRSLRRASSQEVHVEPRRLPLIDEVPGWSYPASALRDQAGSSRPGGAAEQQTGGCPLNIDTVLSMLTTWNVITRTGYPTSPCDEEGSTLLLSPEFVYAQQLALAQHHRRHPKQGAHIL